MAYDSSYITKIKFVRRKKGIELSKIYIKSIKTDNPEQAGLAKTPFRVELDGNQLGYVSLGLFAIITEKKSAIKGTRYHVIVSIENSETLNSVPFKEDMKLTEFVGKVFKADHMILTEDKEGRTVISEDRHYKRKRK